ncbi:hypothetical protein HS088_TW21G01546 [Tripterygium wilfordii]|uniref:Pre-mRNA-splicing factor 38 n=2 Tax=Tripterygium wilfordii TaxID=458696 RepID=A0A7J7C5G6_TRIWF|nr:hypothetical protein HS088_TW21G01546 [Tripterygium wilfordii]
MANRTDPEAKNIRGMDPQNLVDDIVRSNIYQSTYWKRYCFGLSAASLVDRATELDHVGGTIGGGSKATPFLCLAMKLLQIQPEKEIVVEYINNNDFKYVRVLGAFYLRLTGTDVDIYHYLEPLRNDFRKLRRVLSDGQFGLIHVDEFIEELLTKDYSCDVALPRIRKRWNLEQIGLLELRISVLDEDYEEKEREEEEREAGKIEYEVEDEEKDYGGSYRDRDYERRRSDRRDSREVDSYRFREQKGRDWRDRECERRDRDDHGGWWRRRSRRSRSRSRDGKGGENSKRCDRRTSPRRCGDDEDGYIREKPKKKKEKKDDGTDHPDPEISEANRLRASLGLKPLKL